MRLRAEATPARRCGDLVYRSGGGPAYWPFGAARKVWKGCGQSRPGAGRAPTAPKGIVHRLSMLAAPRAN